MKADRRPPAVAESEHKSWLATQTEAAQDKAILTVFNLGHTPESIATLLGFSLERVYRVVKSRYPKERDSAEEQAS